MNSLVRSIRVMGRLLLVLAALVAAQGASGEEFDGTRRSSTILVTEQSSPSFIDSGRVAAALSSPADDRDEVYEKWKQKEIKGNGDYEFLSNFFDSTNWGVVILLIFSVFAIRLAMP